MIGRTDSIHQASARGYHEYADRYMMRAFGNAGEFIAQLAGLIDDIYNCRISGQDIQDFYNSAPDAGTIASWIEESLRR